MIFCLPFKETKNMKDSTEDSLNLPISAVDIYTLDHPRHSIYTIPYSSNYCIHDDSNHIAITLIQAVKKGISTIQIPTLTNPMIEMICSCCNNPTLYIRQLNNSFLCPPCFFIQASKLDGVRASCCDNPLGCDSCGGISHGSNYSKGMIEITDTKYGDLFLCARDECLMPFGYCITPLHHTISCTCDYDISCELSNIIYKDLARLISTYIGARHPTKLERFEGFSADFRPIHSSYCLSCQLFADKQTVSRSWIVEGTSKVCSCSSIFFGRRGSGSLSTLNTPSLRRRKSSGDLRDEYTPSTSEI